MSWWIRTSFESEATGVCKIKVRHDKPPFLLASRRRTTQFNVGEEIPRVKSVTYLLVIHHTVLIRMIWIVMVLFFLRTVMTTMIGTMIWIWMEMVIRRVR